MHELSLAHEVCRIAELQVGHENLARVTAIGVLVGDDAGIEPSSLTFCLETLLDLPPFAGARPVLLPVPGRDLRVEYLELDDGT